MTFNYISNVVTKFKKKCDFKNTILNLLGTRDVIVIELVKNCDFHTKSMTSRDVTGVSFISFMIGQPTVAHIK